MHRKRNNDTRADMLLHSVESMQEREAKRQASQGQASQQGMRYMAQLMAYGIVQVRSVAQYTFTHLLQI